MTPDSEASGPPAGAFLRLKSLSVLLLPVLWVGVLTLSDPNMGGQVPPGDGIVLVVLLLAGPLAWTVGFMTLSTVLAGYTQFFTAGSTPRAEQGLLVAEWVGFGCFVGTIGIAGVRSIRLVGLAVLGFVGAVTVHYCYVVFRVVTAGSGTGYTSLLFEVVFWALYLFVGRQVLESTHAFLFRPYGFRSDGGYYLLFLLMTGAVVAYRHRTSESSVEGEA